MTLKSMILEVATTEEQEQQDRCVVRVRTSSWCDRQGVHVKKDITFLKRMSKGFNLLREEIANIGTDVVEHIINLDQCIDGVYEVVTCNEHRDWETGYVDDYDLRLVPYKEKE